MLLRPRAAGLGASRRARKWVSPGRKVPNDETLFGMNASAAVAIPTLVGKDMPRGSEKSGREMSCGVMQRQP